MIAPVNQTLATCGPLSKKKFSFCNGLFTLTYLFLALNLEMRGALPPNTPHASTALCSVLGIISLFSTGYAASVVLNSDFLKALGFSLIRFQPIPLHHNEIHVSGMSVCSRACVAPPLYLCISVYLNNKRTTDFYQYCYQHHEHYRPLQFLIIDIANMATPFPSVVKC
jgi:hypothetical protein